MQSLPGRKFTGRVAFIDPTVDPKTRTVGVRVVIPNRRRPAAGRRLRQGHDRHTRSPVPAIGGTASTIPSWPTNGSARGIRTSSSRRPASAASAASSWCRPRSSASPASRARAGEALVVPRNAVLMAGDNSVVYVETEPGRFEIRRVVLGPALRRQIVILERREGGRAGCHVAATS